MERKIEFRGKSKKDNEWHYGSLFIDDNYGGGYDYYIEYMLYGSLPYRHSEIVIGESVGQYTSFKDANGKKIYEGDIVKFNNQIGEICFECGSFGIGIKDCVDYETLEAYIGERFYGCLNDNFISLWEIYWNLNCVDYEIDEIEVIGNIYENKELIEKSS